jgi:uncharacterized protein DUF4262
MVEGWSASREGDVTGPTEVQIEAFLDQCRATIAEHGWMVQGVFPTAESVARGETLTFAYTAGLTARGLPEMILVGLPLDGAADLLNDAAKIAVERGAVEFDADVDGIIAGFPVRFTAATTAPLSVARSLYGSRVRAVQMLWPDDQGRFPGDPAYDAVYGNQQPLLRES